MAHLVGDHSSVPAAWRPWLASAISPPVTLGQFGVYYTLLGRQDFGAVEWRHPD